MFHVSHRSHQVLVSAACAASAVCRDSSNLPAVRQCVDQWCRRGPQPRLCQAPGGTGPQNCSVPMSCICYTRQRCTGCTLYGLYGLKQYKHDLLEHCLTLLATNICLNLLNVYLFLPKNCCYVLLSRTTGLLLQLPAEPLIRADHCGSIHDEGPHEGVGQALFGARLRQVWL